jgi:hypothetical protein
MTYKVLTSVLVILSLCAATIYAQDKCKLCFEPKEVVPNPDWVPNIVNSETTYIKVGLDGVVTLFKSNPSRIALVNNNLGQTIAVGDIVTYEYKLSDGATCQQFTAYVDVRLTEDGATSFREIIDAYPACSAPTTADGYAKVTYAFPKAGTLATVELVASGDSTGTVQIRNVVVNSEQLSIVSNEPECHEYTPGAASTNVPTSAKYKTVTFVKDESNPNCNCIVRAYPSTNYGGQVRSQTVNKSDVKDTFCIDTLSTKTACTLKN